MGGRANALLPLKTFFSVLLSPARAGLCQPELPPGLSVRPHEGLLEAAGPAVAARGTDLKTRGGSTRVELSDVCTSAWL